MKEPDCVDEEPCFSCAEFEGRICGWLEEGKGLDFADGVRRFDDYDTTGFELFLMVLCSSVSGMTTGGLAPGSRRGRALVSDGFVEAAGVSLFRGKALAWVTLLVSGRVVDRSRPVFSDDYSPC